MIRPWSEQVAEARQILEAMMHGVDPDAQVEVSSEQGVFTDTVEMAVSKGGKQAEVLVTREAWQGAEAGMIDLQEPFRRILGELAQGRPRLYLITTSGLKSVRPSARAKEALAKEGAIEEGENTARFLMERLGKDLWRL